MLLWIWVSLGWNLDVDEDVDINMDAKMDMGLDLDLDLACHQYWSSSLHPAHVQPAPPGLQGWSLGRFSKYVQGRNVAASM